MTIRSVWPALLLCIVLLALSSGATATPRETDTVHARKVRIWIDEDGIITGRVRVPDGYEACAAGQQIGIYWASGPYWYGPGRGSPYYYTNSKGRFWTREAGTGLYKARVYGDTVGKHGCKSAFSNVVSGSED